MIGVLGTIAMKEFRDGLRNRWVVAITAVFALLAVGLAYFGPAASGIVGFASLATTIVSLASLAVFLIPLIALLLAYDTVVGEQEQGTLLLLFSYPVGRTELLLGKFLGHALIMAVATIVGFGFAALLIAVFTHELGSAELWSEFGYFIVSATLLGWVFIAFAYVISVSVVEKSTAAGLALAVWFVSVIVFDLGLLGVLVATRGAVGTLGREVFPYLLLLNPSDVFRVANLVGFEPARNYAGLAAIATGGALSVWTLSLVLVAWVAAPLGVAVWRFRKKEV